MKKGYTLVEILMGIALFAAIFTVSGVVLFSTFKSSRKAAAVAQAKSEGAYAMRSMSDMIRYAESVTCQSASQITINRPNLDRVIFSYVTTSNPDKIASASGAMVSDVTSSKVAISVPAVECGGSIFDCSDQNRTVKICFQIDKYGGIDVTDITMGTKGILFKTQVTIVNAGN